MEISITVVVTATRLFKKIIILQIIIEPILERMLIVVITVMSLLQIVTL